MEINTLIPLLEKLSLKLGTSVELLWGALIRQAYIDGFIKTFTCMFILILSGIGLYFLRVYYRLFVPHYNVKNKNGHESVTDADFICPIIIVVSLSIILFDTIYLCTTFSDVVISFSNPNYWALKQIIK